MTATDSTSDLLRALDAAAGRSNEAASPLSAAVLALLQDGLQGNRAVPASPWGLVQAAARAYPLQLADTVDRARTVCPGATEEELCHTWALQAVADGSLAPLLSHVAAQPQLLTAYKRGAPLRDKTALQPIIDKLEAVKGTFPGPYHLLQAREQQQQQQQQARGDAGVGGPGRMSADTADVSSTIATSSSSHPSGGSSSSSNTGGTGPAPTSSRVETEEDARRGSSKAAATSGPAAVAGAVAAARAGAAGVAAAARNPLAAGRGLVEPLKRHSQQSKQQQQQEAAVQQTGQGATLQSQPTAAAGGQRQTPSPGSADRQPQQQQQGIKAAAGWLRGAVSRSKQHQAAAADALAAGSSIDEQKAVTGSSSPRVRQQVSLVLSVTEDCDRPVKLVVTCDSSSSVSPLPNDGADAASSSSTAAKEGGGRFRAFLGTGMAAGFKAATAAAAAAVPSVRGQAKGGSSAAGQDPAAAPAAAAEATSPGGPPASSTHSSSIAQEAGSSKAWHLPGKGLIEGLGSSLGRSSRQAVGNSTHEGGSTGEGADAGGKVSRQGTGDVLEEDHWSLLGALKTHKAPGQQQGGQEGGSSGTKASSSSSSRRKAAVQELQEQLQATQPAVLQQATAAAGAVQASAWQGKGVLDEDCTAVLQLVAAVQQLLEHGLIGLVPAGGPAGAASNAVGGSEGSVATGAEGSSKLPGGGSSGGSSGGLSGGWGSSLPNWLVSKQPHPLQALQVLEVGDKQHTPVQLGAGAVLQSTVVRTLPTHQQTEWWVRSSLNQRLLGYRLAVIASRAQQQLAKHYHPGAALLSPPQQLQPLVKAVKGCDVLRFDLTVPQPDAVAPGPASGARAAAAAMAMASQGFNKLAAKLPMVPRLPSFVPGGSGAGGDPHGSTMGATAPTGAAAGVPAPSAFAWPEDGTGATTSSSTAAGGSGHASSSSGRRRVAPIRESAGGPDAESAGDVMSPASSGLLSPLANSEDATADWWSPTEGWVGPASQPEQQNQRSGSSSSSRGATAHQAAVTGAGGEGSSSSRPPSVGPAAAAAAGGGGSSKAPSAAVQQLEQQLSQTLAAPLPSLLDGLGGPLIVTAPAQSQPLQTAAAAAAVPLVGMQL